MDQLRVPSCHRAVAGLGEGVLIVPEGQAQSFFERQVSVRVICQSHALLSCAIVFLFVLAAIALRIVAWPYGKPLSRVGVVVPSKSGTPIP